jgi:hypothetical protein
LKSGLAACHGQLPTPEAHGDGMNTDRVCLKSTPDQEVIDLQIHSGDAFYLKLFFGSTLDRIKARKEPHA